MSREQITLFLLEDRDYLRKSIKQTFEDRHFRVVDAKGIKDGREILEHVGAQVDVLLLDMHLEGSETGADLAEWTKERFSEWPPEIIIHSGYDDVAYYQAALRIGASSYLRKSEFTQPEQLVRYVRALALKRALSPERPGLETALTRAAEDTAGGAEALWRLCRGVLGPEIFRCTGTPCILLLSTPGETRGLGQGVQAPEHSPIYDDIQARLFAAPGPVHPFRFEAGNEPWNRTKMDVDVAGARVFEDLGAAVFMPLAEDHDARLGLGILTASPNGGGDEGIELAAAIHTYLRESLVRHQMRITFAFAQERMKRKVLLESATGACLYTGQGILDLVESRQNDEAGSAGSAVETLQDFRELGEELLNDAQALQTLEDLAEEAVSRCRQEDVELGPLLLEVWSQLTSLGRVPAGGRLEVGLGGTAQGTRGNLRSAFFRLLLWLAQRLRELPPEDRGPLMATIRPAGPWVEVFLEDSSPRLPATLRQRLFSPFSASALNVEEPEQSPSAPPGLPGGRHLGLFLAKAMVETAERGALLDRSDDRTADGHRFIVRLRQGSART